VLAIIAVGCGGESSAPGTLICQADGKTYKARVRRDGLAAVRDAADRAGLADCRLDVGPPSIAHWAEPVRRDPTPRPPPSLAFPINVPPTALDNNRLRGAAQIVPDPETQLEIARSGKHKVIGSYKLCVGVDGDVTSVRPLKSTGFATYDRQIVAELEARKYAPYVYDGNPAPVCTAVTMIFTVPDP